MHQKQERNPGDSKAFAPPHEPERVLYVHGLFVRGREAWGLRHRLRRHGLSLSRFRYSSRGEAPAGVADRLADILRGAPDTHVIAHSLGGLIALTALADAGPVWQGRAVILASPVAGSGCARRVAGLWGGRRVLGAAHDWLCNGLDGLRLPSERVAFMAGTFNHGVGTILRACPPPGDGIVTLAETRVAEAAHAKQFNTTHLGLLFSRDVARAAAEFIRSGVAAARR